MSTPKKKVTIERTLRAPVDRVWKMWTTKEGLEKWWGPEGFTSAVRHLDVRVGGRFEIVMTAVKPEIVAHLKTIGVPESNLTKGVYSEVATNQRLAYSSLVDFVAGVTPYETVTAVEFSPAPGGGTRIVIVNDAMHDENWTKRATQGWESQLGRLAVAVT